MTTNGRLHFDVDALRELAGDKTFARGEAYYRGDQVRILAIEPRRVLAEVTGTEDYRTELRGQGEEIDGECSCPAFEGLGFCKHMVAVALTANSAGGAEGVGALARIRDFLKQQGVDALVEMIAGLAERDPALFRRLDMAAAAVHADDKTLVKRLRTAIDAATRTRGFVDYRAMPGWAANVDAALDAVADLASGARAGLAVELMERAVDRIERAIDDIDDSDGHCGALLHRACSIHLAAAHAARPEPVELARNLFAREIGGGYETFRGAAARYAEILGAAGLAEYRRLAVEAWEKLPPRSGRERERDNPHTGYSDLMHILDFFAERDGDIEVRIALRTKDLSSSGRYLDLAAFCLSQGRGDEALRRAEDGLWLFEDDEPNERLVFLAAELLSRADRNEDARACLWRAFEKAPSLGLYQRLGKNERERATKLLEAGLSTIDRTRWYSPADLLITILMHEGAYAAAWTIVHKHGAPPSSKHILARASEATHPSEALEVYVGRVEQLAAAGGNPAYAEAAELIGHMAALRSVAEQEAHVDALKLRFVRKRNFIKLLA